MVKRRRQSDRQQKLKKKQQEQQKLHEEDTAAAAGEDKVSEDYCFVCKDGGLLIVCDHKNCVKAYHPDCVGQEEATEETDTPWICDWHSCLVCKKIPKYQCVCCPNAVCQSCFKDASFARVRGSKGFCHDCLNLALLGEEGVDVDSDGEKVDFKDRETYEGLFKEYWDIIKEKEGLTLDDLHNADIQIKKGESVKVQCHQPESDSDESVKHEEIKDLSSESSESADDHDSDDAVEPVIVTSIKRTKKMPTKSPKKKRGSSRIEYVGWASKSLLEFLTAIGVDTSNKLSQNDVTSLINKYVQETKLFHPEKRKIVVCDARLRSLLKRKTISIYKISDAIEAHFLDNLDQSEDEGYSSGYEENNASLPTKKQAWWRNCGSFQNKGSLLEKFQLKEGVLEEPKKLDTVVKVVYSDFASIVPQNMKLVYLKRSLVENLLEKYETFESKVVGSFVKVKLEPVNPRYPYQLLPVTGIYKADENKRVLLQVFNLPDDVPINMLSNDDVSEEDCKELLQKIESGLIAKPTVVDLEKKAKDLHEDITKHAIARELSTLKHRIDLANEKGRRAELYEYRRRREVLQSEEEQYRLLNELPKVIADVIEVKPDSGEVGKNNDAEISPSNNPSGKSEDRIKVPA